MDYCLIILRILSTLEVEIKRRELGTYWRNASSWNEILLGFEIKPQIASSLPYNPSNFQISREMCMHLRSSTHHSAIPETSAL